MSTDKQEEAGKRKIWVPYMCDHAYVVSACYRSSGIESDVLPESDEEALRLGTQFCNGKECMPCFVTTGDIVKRARNPQFDASKEAFMMATSPGPCKFGQYHQLQRQILDDLGHEEVVLVTPSSKTSYQDLGVNFYRAAWRGLVAVDLLEKLVRETRPYEIITGETDRVYRECLQLVMQAIEHGSEKVFGVMSGPVKEQFQAIGVDRSSPRPIIGMVGEIYLRANSFSNRNVVRQVEKMGGEMWVAPLAEWFFYTTYRYRQESAENHRWLDYLKGIIRDSSQYKDERRMLAPWEGVVPNLHEPTTRELIANASRYMHESFGGEAVLSIGKSVDYVKKGAAGLLNVTPFACMPGVIVGGIARRLREDYDNVPWLDLMYDGQETTNITTRLEAFMYQARQYQMRLRPRG